MDVDLAVVTGSAGGLGRLITQRLAEWGPVTDAADLGGAGGYDLVTIF